MPSTLAIEQLKINCHVPHAVADNARRARDVLDRVLSSVPHELPEYLERILALEPESDAIVYIDTLQFDVTINAQWPRDRVARALAVQLSRSLWHTLETPNAVRFEDRAEMLARFVVDLTQGAAFSRDWHRAFEGLRLLPASTILRTLIVDEPLAGRTALTRLLPADLDRAIALLSGADAEQTIAALFKAAAPETECEPATLVDAALSQRCFSLETPQQQLALAIAISRQPRANANAKALTLARVLFQLVSAADAGDLPPDVCAARSESALQALVAKGDGPALPLLRTGWSRINADAMVDALRALRRDRPQTQAREQRSTCGGAWVLLPHILSAIGAETVAPALSLCVLAASAGDRSPEVWRNGPLREALGLNNDRLANFSEVTLSGRSPDTPDVSAGVRRHNLAHIRRGLAPLELPSRTARAVAGLASRVMAAYAHRLPGFSGSSFRYLWDNLLATDARVRMDEHAIEVELTPPPLDVIWRISGADRANYVLPDGRAVRVAVRR